MPVLDPEDGVDAPVANAFAAAAGSVSSGIVWIDAVASRPTPFTGDGGGGAVTSYLAGLYLASVAALGCIFSLPFGDLGA